MQCESVFVVAVVVVKNETGKIVNNNINVSLSIVYNIARSRSSVKCQRTLRILCPKC